MSTGYVKIIVFVPLPHANKIRKALAAAGAGKWLSGKYDSVSFSTPGTGRFRPLRGAKPAVGRIGRVEKVQEERIETICRTREARRIIQAVKKAHPYEKPAIDVYPLLSI